MALVGTEGNSANFGDDSFDLNEQWEKYSSSPGVKGGRLVWHNRKGFLPENEACVSVYDSALMFGDMIFEMTRSFGKLHFKLEEHIDRLYRSAKLYQIDIGISKAKFIEAIHFLCEKNKHEFRENDEYRLMINVTRGILPAYTKAGLKEPTGVNIMITVFPLAWSVQGIGKLYDEGINAFISSQRTMSEEYIDPKAKNRSRVHYKFAYLEAGTRGNDEWPLMMDNNGNIAEGPGYNFFLIKNDKIISPKGKNILRGISRKYIKKLCNQLSPSYVGHAVKTTTFKTKDFGLYDIVNADGAFVTGTPFCMLPVVSINGIKIGDGKPHQLYKDLLLMWSQNVGLNIPKQIKNWNNE